MLRFVYNMASYGVRRLKSLQGYGRRFALSASRNSAAANAARERSENFAFKTSENNPVKHTKEQSGLLYVLPQNEATIFRDGGLPKPYMQQCATFNETCLMIREPAVEIIQNLERCNLKNPPSKHVLYGKPGLGKSLTLAHVLHYASTSKWLLLHVPWVGNWLRSPKRYEVVNSTTRPGFVDLPESAVLWLQHFKNQNFALIKELDLRLNNDYEWSKRETSKSGDPLLDIVELGLSRSRHACEVLIAIVQEIKANCAADKCKVLVAVDGFNAFFHSNTRVRNEEKQMMSPDRVSFVPAIMSTTAADYHNAAVVVTCDELVVPGHDASPLPLYQLGSSGFHHLDPFIPVHVPEMTGAEIRNILAYYKERRWLQITQGDDELVFLSGGNPYKLMNLCNPL